VTSVDRENGIMLCDVKPAETSLVGLLVTCRTFRRYRIHVEGYIYLIFSWNIHIRYVITSHGSSEWRIKFLTLLNLSVTSDAKDLVCLSAAMMHGLQVHLQALLDAGGDDRSGHVWFARVATSPITLLLWWLCRTTEEWPEGLCFSKLLFESNKNKIIKQYDIRWCLTMDT